MNTLLARRYWRELSRATLDLLVPAHCPTCGAASPDDGPCRACGALLEDLPVGGWPRCGAPLHNGRCVDPDAHRAIQGLRFVVCRWHYRGAAGGAVRRWKFEGDLAALHWLVRGMAQAVRAHGGAPRRAVVVSVPVHPRKRRERGRDHAALLARELVGSLAARPWQMEAGVLHRTRATLPQGDPRVTSREKNVAGAFRVRRPHVVRDRPVVLVDAVLTSGAPARECARVLRRAGAAAVGLVVACAARDR